MHLSSLSAVTIYLLILVVIGVSSYRKHQTSNDFLIGARKLNFWLTALAAHASDMSSWIFMGYPAVIFSLGLSQAWLAIGITIFMYLNWQFVAPKLRTMTETYNSLTLPSFFESRFADTTGFIRIFTVLASFVYYTIYISAGLVGLGLLLETLFGIGFITGVTIGVCIIVPYLFIGGYVTLAWTDFFQGLFLVTVIVMVPLFALPHVGGFQALRFENFIPDYSPKTLISLLFLMCSWGLGYFGIPHIVTKFMGIKDVKEMPKSKWIGITWQTISVAAATLVGLVAVVFFKNGLNDPQFVFIDMVLKIFPPFLAAFILCAILGATITSIDSQILVLATNLAEDFYKRILRKDATSRELLIVSRSSIAIVAIIAYCIACNTTNTIFNLVSYAWFGLGASFGPLVLFSLYSKTVNRYGAWAGVVVGSILSGVWPLINRYLPLDVPTLIPGFFISSFTIWFVSTITRSSSIRREQI